MAHFDLYFDVFFIILLSCMIFYSIRLNRQLKVFAESRDHFQSMVKDINHTFGEAGSNMKSFENLSTDSSQRLDEKILLANALVEELRFMVESADRIATRLEQASEVSNSRAAKEINVDRIDPEVDYYKASNPASMAARRDAAMGNVSRTSNMREIPSALSRQMQSKAEKDVAHALKVKAR